MDPQKNIKYLSQFYFTFVYLFGDFIIALLIYSILVFPRHVFKNSQELYINKNKNCFLFSPTFLVFPLIIFHTFEQGKGGNKKRAFIGKWKDITCHNGQIINHWLDGLALIIQHVLFFWVNCGFTGADDFQAHPLGNLTHILKEGDTNAESF